MTEPDTLTEGRTPNIIYTAEEAQALWQRGYDAALANQQDALDDDPPECEREKWCDMPGGHRGECRSADDRLDAPEGLRAALDTLNDVLAGRRFRADLVQVRFALERALAASTEPVPAALDVDS